MTRAEAIEILKKLIEAMQGHVTVLPTPERIATIRLAIASLETDEAYQLEYEKPTTKNDLPQTMEELIKHLTDKIPSWKVILIDKWTDFKVWLWIKTHKGV